MFKCLCLWLRSGGKLGSSLHQVWSSFTKVSGFLDSAIYWQFDRGLTNSRVLVKVEDMFLSLKEVFSLVLFRIPGEPWCRPLSPTAV